MAFCSNCGKEIPAGSKFCSECGATTSQGEVVQSVNETNTTTTLQTNVADSPKQLDTNIPVKKRMSFIWGIIAMALGIAGLVIHITWPSVALSIAALIVGIICLSKKSRLYGFAIAAVVFTVINFLTYVIAYDAMNKEMTVANSKYSENSSIVSNGTSEKKDVPAGVDPDLVEFLDSYEDFVDKYCEFMQKYSENPTDFTLLADYASIMQEYTEFADKINQYDSKTMSTADANYYLEVTTRCTQKMLTVAGSMSESGTN